MSVVGGSVKTSRSYDVLAATPADVSLMMQLGVDGVFVGSGIFKSTEPARRAAAIVEAVTNYDDANLLARVSYDLGQPMVSDICYLLLCIVVVQLLKAYFKFR